jgi:hypothetical protein
MTKINLVRIMGEIGFFFHYYALILLLFAQNLFERIFNLFRKNGKKNVINPFFNTHKDVYCEKCTKYFYLEELIQLDGFTF